MRHLPFVVAVAVTVLPIVPLHAQDHPAVPDDIIVTATKQAQTINRVPVTVTAKSQADLDRQQINSVQDLARTVPGFAVTASNNPRGANIGVRGIVSSIGAPTTAVYLDDIPLQRRSTLGTFSGSGVVFPQLFDLDRVEILKGPQGTLYGGSAEGGAVRFLTPRPSLDHYSDYAKLELSGTRDGGANYQAGIAVGGPIIPGRLGFRVSAVERRDSGYLDHVDIYTGNVIGRNTNAAVQRSARAVLLWQVSDKLTISPAIYAAYQRFADNDSFWENVPAVAVPTRSFTATGAAATGSNGPVNFTLPGHIYGPYDVFGPYRTGQNCNIGENYKDRVVACYRPSPRRSVLWAPSLSADYDLPWATLHLATAYIHDRNSGANDGSYNETAPYQGGIPFLYTMPVFAGYAVYDNRRDAVSGELRLASRPGERMNWVAGLYFSSQKTVAESHDYTDMAAFAPAIRGISDTLLYGTAVAPDGDVTARYQTMREREVAAFGELTYPLTNRLKAIAGLRVSSSRFHYNTRLAGSFFGYAVPTVENGGLSQGAQSDTPVTPKVGLQYDVDAHHMVYGTVAKGYRPGGVNNGAYQFKCQSTFQSLGITDTPRTYDSDTLWSYQLGAKGSFLDGLIRLDVSAFHVDWRNVQANYSLPNPCGFSYTTNAHGAVSDGVDFQGSFHPVRGLSADLAAAFTKAHYTQSLVGPAPTYSMFIPKGTELPTPRFQYNINLRYDFRLAARTLYLSGGYQHASGYQSGFGPLSSSFNIDTDRLPATNYVTARLGLSIDRVEIAVFADNLLNSQDILSRSGGRSCGDSTCSVVRSYSPIFSDTTYRPRTIGLSLISRR